MRRQAALVGTIVELADSLVDDFDVVELLRLLTDRCVDVLGADAAGILLLGPEGELRVVASSNEAVRMLELLEVQAEDGPCLECLRTGAPVVNADLGGARGRWPCFAPEAAAAGYSVVHAVPMRLRGTVIGALNLFDVEARPEGDDVAGGAQALADIATIAILQHRAVTEARSLNAELHEALNSRVAIEQAKGVLAERQGIGMEEAFARIRNHATSHGLRLADVAQAIVSGTLPTAMLGVSVDGRP